MLTPFIISGIIIGLIIFIPILANIPTPENLTDWYTANAYKAALILGAVAIAIVWVLYFTGIIG